MVQPVTNRDKQHVQQLIITSMPTTVQIISSLPTHTPRGYDH
jgi:hypothetical protein